MGFLSYHLSYYRRALHQFENEAASRENLYLAQQLLKILDDLEDEGYSELNEALEANCSGVSRLRAFLQLNGAVPFPVRPDSALLEDPDYAAEELELVSAIDELMQKAAESSADGASPFTEKLIRFCEWIGAEPDTAYIFLLRDTLLPYVYYHSRGCSSLHPWLLGRKALTAITGVSNADDELRSLIIDALEEGQLNSLRELCETILPGIKTFLNRYPQVCSTIGSMLKQIPERHIIVVESGCSGTFPMLLMGMDERVDLRMYTSYPYLFDAYKEKLFTSAYEENRLFETLASQDQYLRFASLHDERYFVVRSRNRHIEEKALAEVKKMLCPEGGTKHE